MGRLKDSLLEAEGWKTTPGQFVCADAFDDAALRELVRVSAISKRCSYTDTTSKKPIAAPLDTVVEHIFACLVVRYEDATNGVGWDHGFDEGVKTWDTEELIDETVAFTDQAGEDLKRDIVAALPMWTWSHIDPYGPRKQDVMRWSWDDFTRTVKHVRRYFFQQHLEPREWREEKVSPVELLKSVVANCRSYGLMKTLPPGQRFYRCRPEKAGESWTLPEDLGPPPPEKASQSRMSPAGIPMFYGARDEKTAKAETLTNEPGYAMAEFRTTRAIHVLDLTTIPFVSIFDPKLGRLNDWCQFMRSFIADFQLPVAHDGAQHIEYVPTQIVTEYIRSARGKKKRPIDGVLYSSVKIAGTECVVLFADKSDVAPLPHTSKNPSGTHLLKLRHVVSRLQETEDA